MPRPGPRPYVCERRAWHSDRHKPMRGSLIKEIFRVANEIHSSATRKNKEWQEKLPVVVLKVEEIMYSKANSEAEYLDLRTLWDRTNDAINTIIRRDEIAETGEFLQPCIEAALILGCTPRRALRSQRNGNPRCFLDIGPQETESIAERNHAINTACLPDYPDFFKSNSVNLMHLGSQPQKPIVQHSNKFVFASKHITIPCKNQSSPISESPASNSYAMYPPYYGDQHQFQGATPESNPHMGELPFLGINGNCFSSDEDGLSRITRSDIKETVDAVNPCGVLCDLSLRLAPLSAHFPAVVQKYAQELDRGIDYTSQERQESGDPPTSVKGLSSLLESDGIDISNRNVQSKCMNIDAAMKKHNAGLGPSGHHLFCWQPKHLRGSATGRMKNAGFLGEFI